MACLFRFRSPALGTDVVRRPRLLRLLSQRWQHPVTVLAGGAGLGKTTALAQALAHNRSAPRGEDVWLGVTAVDVDDTLLADAVRRALAGRRVAMEGAEDPGAVDPQRVADAMWQRAPRAVCLVLDDVHLLPPDSAGARWLASLVEALPDNGHLVLATRDVALPMGLARIHTHGAVLWVKEDELRFDDQELRRFAAHRGLDVRDLEPTGGWPALAELTARAGHLVRGIDFWSEAADASERQRRVLAALCILGAGDDELVSAALGEQVQLDRDLASVPLMERRPGGWYVPHALWRATDVHLPAPERDDICRRGVRHLCERGDLDEAFRLLSESRRWELAPAVLRAACLGADRGRPQRLRRWLDEAPPSVSRSVAGRLAAAIHMVLTAPGQAVEPLRAAVHECRAEGDVDAELCAIAHLARLAWLLHDAGVVGPDVRSRVLELAAAGHEPARALAAFGRAMVADILGDDEAALSALSTMEVGALGHGWEPMASWLEGVIRLGRGDVDAVTRLVEGYGAIRDPALRLVLDGLRLRSWWAAGRVDEVLREAGSKIDAVRSSGVAATVHVVSTNSSVMFAYTGDVDAARRCLDEGTAASPFGATAPVPARTALATASLQLAEGDPRAAAATLRQAIAAHGLDQGVDRRGWRHTMALTYVLLPETRPYWNGLDLAGYLVTTRRLAEAVVRVRSGASVGALRRLELPGSGEIRSALPVRFAAELAVAMTSAGRPEGPALLDELGPAGRRAVRAAADGRTRLAKAAGAVLASLPATPAQRTYLAVLGPLRLHRDGVECHEQHLQRSRVHELLAFLLAHPTTTRATICAALWPDKPRRTAGNNLSVTVNHLHRALEPWRRPGEAPYLVRLDGQRVELRLGDHLATDRDDFRRHVDAARRAEEDGLPSLVLENSLAAVELYRGDLHSDLPAADWLVLERERLRGHLVHVAVRAAELLVGQGRTEQAEWIALQALQVDPRSEGAHVARVAAAVARGDRSTARRALVKGRRALAQLGVRDSPTMRELERRIGDVAGPSRGACVPRRRSVRPRAGH